MPVAKKKYFLRRRLPVQGTVIDQDKIIPCTVVFEKGKFHVIRNSIAKL
jgi:hypothetical protein